MADLIEDDTRDSRKMDPELLVMSRMLRLLDELDEPASRRVVAWLRNRYECVTDARD